eukprot:2874495-Rhodomonas_salina.1
MDWINKIELKVQMLVIARVPALAINSAFCGNIIARLGNFGDCSSTTATRWVASTDTLLASNNSETYIWSQLHAELTATLSADLRADENHASGSGAKKGRVVTDGTAFFTAAHIKKAFFLGQNQGPKSSTPGSPAPKDGGGNNKN